VAPFAGVVSRFHAFAWECGLDEAGRAAFWQECESFFGPGRLNSLSPATLAGSAKAAALVIHDAGDDEIPVAEGRDLAEAWPASEFRQTDGLGHVRIIRDRRTVAAATDFLSRES
ncbi:MAG: hypothetical protein MH204_10945, partial [Fimbriimonadaceae bacterium]|nr:hypothetical protein [Fimbriimonadaceae bacterium]